MKVSIVIQRLFHGSHLILSLCSANFIPRLVPPGTDIFWGGKKSQHQFQLHRSTLTNTPGLCLVRPEWKVFENPNWVWVRTTQRYFAIHHHLYSINGSITNCRFKKKIFWKLLVQSCVLQSYFYILCSFGCQVGTLRNSKKFAEILSDAEFTEMFVEVCEHYSISFQNIAGVNHVPWVILKSCCWTMNTITWQLFTIWWPSCLSLHLVWICIVNNRLFLCGYLSSK